MFGGFEKLVFSETKPYSRKVCFIFLINFFMKNHPLPASPTFYGTYCLYFATRQSIIFFFWIFTWEPFHIRIHKKYVTAYRNSMYNSEEGVHFTRYSEFFFNITKFYLPAHSQKHYDRNDEKYNWKKLKTYCIENIYLMLFKYQFVILNRIKAVI